MYLVISQVEYTEISDLSFAPSTDVTGNSLSIDEFYAVVHTEETIPTGRYASLYDDRNNRWAKFWIVEADRIDETHVRVHAMSDIALLDCVTMPAELYSNAPVVDVLDDIFAFTPSAIYTLDSPLSSMKVSGFCPEQTARERLFWICFALSAYVRQSFADAPLIKVISQTVEKNVPIGKTKYKPTIAYGSYVSKVTVRAYSFAQGTPAVTDRWVTDGTNYYIVTTQDYSLSNPESSALPDNEVIIDGVYLVNPSNVSDILSYFAGLYFNRVSVTLDAINNFDYYPGEKVTAYADEDVPVSGYIESCAFAFGLQAMSSIKLVAVDETEGARLTIIYKHGGASLAKRRYSFPVGYAYFIENPYLDLTGAENRIVYRPLAQYAEGTIVGGSNVDVEQCEPALELNLQTGILYVISVDEITARESGDIIIGDIA